MTTLPLDQIIFREDLYPRIKTDARIVQKYAEDLSVLPPIEINQKNELIDGWHRWTAHKKAEAKEICVLVTLTASDGELLELAIERNAKFGLQLSRQDKQHFARKIYHDTPHDERGPKKQHLAAILSVSLRIVESWLARIDQGEEEQRDCTIRKLWLACWTQEEIAAAVGVTQQRIGQLLQANATFRFLVNPGDFGDVTLENDPEYEKKRLDVAEESNRASAEHRSDFEVPLYNIWKQQEKTDGAEHFGNTEIRWLDNLLYLYTRPFDIVVDPFAGGGSTIELCAARLRRYYVSDRKPVPEREKEIRKHDITSGLPTLHNWKDVKLIYLDPPYWWQAKAEYSEDPADFGNMPLEEFTENLSSVVKAFSKKLTDAVIALVISPTQWPAPERKFTDHIADLLRLIKLPIDMRFSAPYESQQYNGNQVKWAKENKKCLVLTREIIVWKV